MSRWASLAPRRMFAPLARLVETRGLPGRLSDGFRRWLKNRRARAAVSSKVALVALVAGAAAGLSVVAVQELVPFLQRAALGFAAERRIALPEHSSALRVAAALVIGALAVSGISALMRRFVSRSPIDAVEANALRGGKMTWRDGVAVVLPILVSVGFGASVGIEAAVTQIGAVMASIMGRALSLPRSDLRLAVGAGAAAAIAAAYRAPIAGMLYAYELVLGSYTKRTLVPVALAVLAAFAVVQLVGGTARPFLPRQNANPVLVDYPIAVATGVIAALLGIGTMVLVGAFERLLGRIAAQEWVRRVLSALALSLLAWRFPMVLGSGHASIDAGVNGDIQGREAVAVTGAKALASSISLAGGFRGGLFGASLMLGALLGQSIAWATQVLPMVPVANPTLCALVGMASLGACIIGSPLAMAFLVLESTGDYDATLVVAAGTITATYVTDRLFGYSFATWRFQQRGLAVEGGHDVSRLTVTPVADLVRRPKFSLTDTASLADAARAMTIAGSKGVAIFSQQGAFLGLVDPTLLEIVQEEDGPLPVAAIDLIDPTVAKVAKVTENMALSEVVAILQRQDWPALPVVSETNAQVLVGILRARDVFRRAAAIADAQRREDLGLFKGD
jgi:chloride channel protein, CIC family